jgi:hypothetical protein
MNSKLTFKGAVVIGMGIATGSIIVTSIVSGLAGLLGKKKEGAKPGGQAGFDAYEMETGESRRIGQLPEHEFKERLAAYEMETGESRRIGQLPENEFRERLAAYEMESGEARRIGADDEEVGAFDAEDEDVGQLPENEFKERLGQAQLPEREFKERLATPLSLKGWD